MGLRDPVVPDNLKSIFPVWPVLQGMAGVYLLTAWWLMPDTRVVVFIDYQNVYHCARDLFGDPDESPSMLGSVYPRDLGDLLCGLGKGVDPHRLLAGVRVYRGQPDSRSGTKLSRAFDQQVAAWRETPGVSVHTRPLKYHRTSDPGRKAKWVAREKGVDVMMALDISIGARSNSYDVAIVVSSDTDLLPALEDAVSVGKRVETATWWVPKSPRGPLRVPGRRIWNHYLDKSLFDLVRDDTDYLTGVPRRDRRSLSELLSHDEHAVFAESPSDDTDLATT